MSRKIIGMEDLRLTEMMAFFESLLKVFNVDSKPAIAECQISFNMKINKSEMNAKKNHTFANPSLYIRDSFSTQKTSKVLSLKMDSSSAKSSVVAETLAAKAASCFDRTPFDWITA
jgi:hypothetical protein